MHVLLHDYASYPFTKQLALQLADSGCDVTYAYNAGYDGPNSQASLKPHPGVSYLPLKVSQAGAASSSFSKRLKMELAYSSLLVREVSRLGVDVILSANTPSLVQSRLLKQARSQGIRFISWIQDLYGVAAHRLLRKRLPVVGSWIGHYFMGLDKRSLRLSDETVLITEDFRGFARSAGVADNRLHVIENWAPVADIPCMPKDNEWSRTQGLQATFRFVYSGTLAMKHNPMLLVELAKSLMAQPRVNEPPAELLVVSSSAGARWLAEQVQSLGLTNVRCLDFQPSSAFPSILGSADVLVAVLESDAGEFSVPSKVLSYLCAGKPILAAIPSANLAARIIRSAGVGHVVEPTSPQEFAAAGLSMMQATSTQRQQWGEAARRYAEHAFDSDRITSRFLSILNKGQHATAG